ncbi:hypothetical protein E2C01_101565 [Portunus trituberculatus]|uniref:Uncharacterized protein n=1 Tax=Portunus trituberculatus TaxID=210409 RepID=A0A5B7KGC8_PORTR|nr:hypothetical protein [Portunus trituberculatus]
MMVWRAQVTQGPANTPQQVEESGACHRGPQRFRPQWFIFSHVTTQAALTFHLQRRPFSTSSVLLCSLH